MADSLVYSLLRAWFLGTEWVRFATSLRRCASWRIPGTARGNHVPCQ